MRQVLTILFLLTLTDLLGQIPLNKHDRLTKDEFAALKTSRDQFIPVDIKKDTVVIIRYSPSRLGQLQAIARNTEFASNGEDTTGYTDEKLFGAKQAERGRQMVKKTSNEFPIDRAKALQKKGIVPIIVDEETLKSTTRYADKYWLTTLYLCNQNGLKGPWVTTITNRVYDPRTGKFYEAFFPTNYDLIDLLE
jgi:hypothetical protein